MCFTLQFKKIIQPVIKHLSAHSRVSIPDGHCCSHVVPPEDFDLQQALVFPKQRLSPVSELRMFLLFPTLVTHSHLNI